MALYLQDKKYVAYQKEAFLSNALLWDIRRLNEENGLRILTGKKQSQMKL